MKKTFTVFALSLLAAAAQAEIVVVGHPSAGALTADQVSDIYLGKSQSSTPLDQPESAPIRAEFYKRATGKDLPQVKATWARLAFTGKAQPPKEFDAAGVKKEVAGNPKAIGYLDSAAVDGSVKVLLTLN
jgi:ABC-type phosphate transport system substrate-binding protein